MKLTFVALSAAGILLLLLCVQPALGSPDAVSYEEYVTLVHDQSSEPGCIGYSMTHVLEILKEMEVRYTPDPSYAFLNYVFYESTAGGTDLRVPSDSSMNGWPILWTFGLPPETSYPTNFDPIGHTVPEFLAHRPPDSAFDDAAPYRVETGFEKLHNPTIAQAEEWLDARGPAICHSLYINHTVALIGYDRFAGTGGEFIIVDSANYEHIPYAGIKRVPYAYFASMGPNITLESVTNRPTPMAHPYTARIRISHEYRRSDLSLRIGAVGHLPVTVWAQNNRVDHPDWGKDLAIDVPLPAYAAEHWPPLDQNQWYIQVTNHKYGYGAMLNEVTLVKRDYTDGPSSAVVYEVYPEIAVPVWISTGTTELKFPPKRITVTAPKGGEAWAGGQTRAITWDQTGLDGTDVQVELRKGPAQDLVEIIAVSVPAQDGHVAWTIPVELATGSDYYVRVQSMADPQVGHRSTGPLTVTSPEAGFSAKPVAGYAPLTVYFQDTSDGVPSSWFWNFGDGTISTLKSPTHTYAAAGTYTVSLTVSYGAGGSRSVMKPAEVTVQPLTGGLIRVEAEDYNPGGEGVGYHDTEPENLGGAYRPDEGVDIQQLGRTGGFVVMNISSNEWTRYSVLSGAQGMHDYPFSLRVAGFPVKQVPQSITVNVSGVPGEVAVTVPNTGSEATYVYANATLRLKPGPNTVQFTYHGAAIAFDYFTLDPSGVPAWITITPTIPPVYQILPGAVGPPTSISISGLYDDLNGNLRKDFADIVLYFNQMAWIAANEPVEGFDYNLNRRVDFADVVWLFNHL